MSQNIGGLRETNTFGCKIAGTDDDIGVARSK
jgi:hypothetical protein